MRIFRRIRQFYFQVSTITFLIYIQTSIFMNDSNQFRCGRCFAKSSTKMMWTRKWIYLFRSWRIIVSREPTFWRAYNEIRWINFNLTRLISFHFDAEFFLTELFSTKQFFYPYFSPSKFYQYVKNIPWYNSGVCKGVFWNHLW